MRDSRKFRMGVVVGLALAMGIGAVALLAGGQAGAQRAGLRITPLMKQVLGSVEGKEVTVIKLDYPPGAASPAHRHPGDVFVYVLSGKLTSQLNDEDPVVYGPGEIFYEAPMGLHAQSKNDEKEEHAVAIAFIIGDTGKPQTLAPGSH